MLLWHKEIIDNLEQNIEYNRGNNGIQPYFKGNAAEYQFNVGISPYFVEEFIVQPALQK
jgi:hypothetical protein